MELCTQTVANDDVLITRRSASHNPTVWGDHFLSYAHLPEANEGEEKQHENLKEEVRKMLRMAPSKSLEKLDLINTIQCLGVAYHFENEIEESLSYIYTSYEEWIDGNDDLHTIALCFRLLRQQGYRVSCDGFRKFTNDEGNFKNELVNDVHGMLSLYEAAQFRVHGEDILDEALNFSITQLKLILPKLSNSQLAQQVSNALKFSIKDGLVRLETKKYISVYQESGNQVLLNFAKLDFNILQRLHQKELCDLTRWWTELKMVKALPYVRDRLAEAYFWSLGVYFEPKYSFARNMLTKFVYLLTILDDTYDIYGTLDELTLLTGAIERWDIDASEQLPSYMKIIYRDLLDIFNEIEKELPNENKSFLFDYSIPEMKKVMRGYFQEAKWYHGKKIPKMEEYIKNGIQTGAYVSVATICYLGMASVAIREAFDWIATEPPIIVASCIIARLLNDLSSHEEEQKRGDVASAIECYMEEFGVTKEEAEMKIRNIIENNWKDLNEEYLKLTIVMPKILLMPMINLTRVAEFVYKEEDAYTFSKNNMKDVISSLLIDPII